MAVAEHVHTLVSEPINEPAIWTVANLLNLGMNLLFPEAADEVIDEIVDAPATCSDLLLSADGPFSPAEPIEPVEELIACRTCH